MHRSFKSRIAALEQLEAEEQRLLLPPPPPQIAPPPAFDAVLAQFDLLLAALIDGRAHVGPTAYTWKDGVQIAMYGLWGMPDPDVCAAGVILGGIVRDLGIVLTTVEEYTAWLRADRRSIAFWRSRTDAELEAYAAMPEDSLFYTAEQHVLVDVWAQLVEQGDADEEL